MKIQGWLSLVRCDDGKVLLTIEDPRANATAAEVVMTEEKFLDAFVFGDAQVKCEVEIPEYERLGKKFETKKVRYVGIENFPYGTDRAYAAVLAMVFRDNGVDGWSAEIDEYAAKYEADGSWTIEVPFVRWVEEKGEES